MTEIVPDGPAPSPATAAQLLVAALERFGVERVFGVPGESFLAVLDALVDSPIAFVPNRHEGGAAFMAEATAKLTGRPGVCFVTRGPGSTNAAIGVHSAMQAATPMVLFVGQVERASRGRGAFQEIDQAAMFAPVAKAAFELDDPDRVTEIVARAWATAVGGRPGPVVVALPEDVIAAPSRARPLSRAVEAFPPPADPAAAQATARALLHAERPLVLLGGGWDADPAARATLGALAEAAAAARVPIAVCFRCQDLIDNASLAYVGDAGVGMGAHVRRLIGEAEVLLALGARLGEVETEGYTLLEPPEPRQTLIQVHPSDEELGRVYQAAASYHAGAAAFAAALAEALLDEAAAGEATRAVRETWAGEGRAAYEAALAPAPVAEGLDLGAVMACLRERLPGDAIVTNGAGNFAVWPSRHIVYGPGHRLLAPQSGAMGYGLPAAIAAKLAFPERAVICFAGDGDFQMTMAELGTAMQTRARPVVLVVNNGSWGTIRMHQERRYPGRVSATAIENPDYPAIARAYGMMAERVASADAFAPAFEAALASETGALIELIAPSEAVASRSEPEDLQGAVLGRVDGGA